MRKCLTACTIAALSPGVLLSDGTLPIPVADGTLPLPLTRGVGTVTFENEATGEEDVLPSEGTLRFHLDGRGQMAIPKEWLADGTLPLFKVKELSRRAIDVNLQSGLSLPRGLNGIGKLVIPEPSSDGGNPWPSVDPGMLPWVLTGSGTVNLADGTWPLPRLAAGGSEVSRGPATPEG